MIWLAAFVILLMIALSALPEYKWKESRIYGIISIIVLYLIDSTLVNLGAFSFKDKLVGINGLPVFYLASGYIVGILFINYQPARKGWGFPYILFNAVLLLVIELFFVFLGNFIYYKWSPINSLFLNIFGFTLTLWICQWVELLKPNKYQGERG